MAIGIAKGVNFKVEERLTDLGGRYIFLKGSLEGWECTLANVYAPNKEASGFLVNTLEKLMDFKKGGLIMMGDRNLCLAPEVDSMSRALGKMNAKLRKLKQKLYSCQLVDVWRIMNPNKKDFSFYSPVHGTYSRIDYIWIEHSLLDRVVESKIEATTLSDHAPVSMFQMPREFQ